MNTEEHTSDLAEALPTEPLHGLRALASVSAADMDNPLPALSAGLDAWASIRAAGPGQAADGNWATLGRALALFGGLPAGTIEERLAALGFEGLTTAHHETATRACSALFAAPKDADPGTLVTSDDRMLWLDHFDPLTLLAALLRLRAHTPRAEWWRLLGLNWVRFEVELTREEDMRKLIREADPADRAAMMTPLERTHLAQLPEVFTVYRGCYGDEGGGLSWSLSPTIAARFPFIPQYRREGETPLLLSGQVQRDGCVLLLSRGELEVIATDPERVNSGDLTGYTPDPWPWVHVEDPDAGRLG